MFLQLQKLSPSCLVSLVMTQRLCKYNFHLQCKTRGGAEFESLCATVLENVYMDLSFLSTVFLATKRRGGVHFIMINSFFPEERRSRIEILVLVFLKISLKTRRSVTVLNDMCRI